MNNTTFRLGAAVALALFAAQNVHARGFGGARGGGYPAGESRSGSYHAGGFSSGGYHESASHESGGYAHGSEGSAAVERGSSEETYHGANGATVEHGTAEVHGAAAGPGGAAAGGREVSGTEVKGPQGNEYTHESSAGRGVAAGPEGAESGRYASSDSTYHGAEGAAYSHGAAGYGTAHTALPTDAGFGVTAARIGTVGYAGYHHTEAVSGSVYAARGAAVRTTFNNPGLYGESWHVANPGARAPAGWTGYRAWSPATWPLVGTSLGWGGIQPVSYDYGSNVTYQDNEVYYGNQPAATAADYYQQASTLAGSAPAAADDSGDWLPLGVFALVQKDESDPHYVMNLAINKSGAIRGNYSDLISETTVPIQGAVDKRTQRAAWTVGKNKTTVCETGLYNLTKDEAPALIHRGKDKTQQWTLVRLKQPAAAGGEK